MAAIDPSAAVVLSRVCKVFSGPRRLRDALMPWRPRTRFCALDGVDLEVRRGELVALLGPNGAGKTTLLKVLATLVIPDSGLVEVDGLDVTEDADAVRARLGYVLADDRSFFWRLSCFDNLRFFAALQGIQGRLARERVAAVAVLVGLKAELPRPFMDLSAGQRQRMAIARSLLADPPVLLFDEATRSLDPGRAARFRRLVRELLVDRQGKTILFATHDLAEAKEIADRVILMASGSIVAVGTYEQIEAKMHEVFLAEAEREDETEDLAAILGGQPGDQAASRVAQGAATRARCVGVESTSVGHPATVTGERASDGRDGAVVVPSIALKPAWVGHREAREAGRPPGTQAGTQAGALTGSHGGAKSGELTGSHSGEESRALTGSQDGEESRALTGSQDGEESRAFPGRRNSAPRRIAAGWRRLRGLVGLMAEFLRRDFKIALSYRLQFVFQVSSVLSVAIAFFFVSLMMHRVEHLIPSLAKYGGSYFGFVLVGIAFSSYLDAALHAFSAAIRQAQVTGTMEAMVATKTRLFPLVVGSALYPLSFAGLRTAAYLAFGVVVGVAFHPERWALALAVLALTVASTMALGIFSAGFIVLFKQGDPLTAALGALSWLLSGILYPREILPEWVQRLADFLPMTHTLEAMRLTLLAGAGVAELARSILFLSCFALLGIPASMLWFRWSVGRARLWGSLAKY